MALIRFKSVDVVDERVVANGDEFTLVPGTGLPFETGSFDVVLSNHVIEHVGALQAQQHHVTEIRRVLERRPRLFGGPKYGA